MLGPENLREHRLPPGRHGLTRAQVAENQRLRLLVAVAEERAERGRVGTTSSRVARRAGVSPVTFYAHYDDVSECLLGAHELAAECVWEIFERSCEEPGIDWRRRMDDGLRRTLRFLAAEPALAGLLGPQTTAGDAPIAAAHEHLVQRLARRLRAAWDEEPADRRRPAPGTERQLVGGAFAIVAERVAAGEAALLPQLGPTLLTLLSGKLGM